MNSIDVTIFGIELAVKPIAFTIKLGSFTWDIYWYGIIIALGFLLALIYGYTHAKRFNLDLDRMLDVILVAVPVAILSARTYYVIFDGEKLESIGDFFGFGDSSGFSGIAIYGGVIGAFLSGGIMCFIRKVKILDMFDIAAVGFLIGQGVGRWGNFVNQEAFGSLTGSDWWGMESVNTIAVAGEGMVHPCFLYESIWCIAGFFLLNYFSKKRAFSGQIILMYCSWYGFGRGFIELLRTDSLMLGAIRVSSLLSFLLCISATTALVIINRKLNQKEEAYTSLFADAYDEEDETSESDTEIINNTEETENDENN